MMFRLQINKFLCVILYFFDVFISCRKCQDTLQLNTCVKYCTKDQRNAMLKVSKIHCTVFNALNAMFVEDVKGGVCGFYANVYRHTVYCIHAPRPSKREGSF